MDRALAAIAALLAGAACADETAPPPPPPPPAEPTWAEHVKPIVDSVCIDCHGGPALGASTSFRLDSLDDRAGVDGELLTEGAGAMAEIMAVRALDGHGGLDPDQVDAVVGWADQAGPFDGSAQPARPPRGVRPDNQPPTITVTELDRTGSVIRFDYRIVDPDLESVYGEVRVGADLGTSRILPVSLHTGAGRFTLDTAGEPAGELRLFAILDDGSPPQTTDLGPIEVAHDGGDVPPRIAVLAPPPWSVLADPDTVEVVFDVVDPDAAAPQLAEVRAIGPDGTVTIAADLPVTAGTVSEVPWTTTDLPEGTWVVEVEIAGRIARSGPLTISHATTTETWASIAPILETRCAGCHRPGLLFDLPIDLGRYRILGAGEPPGAFDVRAQLFRRVMVLGDMPPIAGPARLDPPIPLTADERARLGSWLRAGAPE